MRASEHRLDALIVRLVDFGDNDRIVGLLTAEMGKVSAFARAAKRSEKRFGAGLDLFARVTAHLRPAKAGRSGLWTLDRIELIDLHAGLRSDLGRLAAASYLAECLWMLEGEESPHGEIFNWFARTLLDLSDPARPFTIDPRRDLEMLALCGFQPSWEVCAECGGAVGVGNLFFSFSRGGVVCTRCRPIGEGRWLDAGLARSGGEGAASSQREELQSALDAFVTYTAGREPKSRRFREEVCREVL